MESIQAVFADISGTKEKDQDDKKTCFLRCLGSYSWFPKVVEVVGNLSPSVYMRHEGRIISCDAFEKGQIGINHRSKR